MATSTELHTAIGAVLDGVTGLKGSATPPSGLNPPFAFPALTGWRPETMGRTGGVITATFDLYVITATSARPQDGYTSLQTFIDWSGASSVYLAIWDANSGGSFNGLANTQVVALEYRQLDVAEMDTLQGYGGVYAITVKTKES